jgi:hypothetical protein
VETSRPRKHRSLLEECLKRLEVPKKFVKTVDDAKASAPVDADKKKQTAETELKK